MVRIAAFLAAMSIAACAHGDNIVVETSADRERDSLIVLEREWIDAEINKDRAALERILHPRFVSTFQSGTTVDRGGYIDIIVGMDLEPFTVSGHLIELHGDTAVVIDTLDGGNTKFTWIGIKQNDRWSVIAQTFSPKPTEPK